LPEGEGKLGYVAGLDLVRQSIETILDTEPGERIMRPSFGCGLRRYLMAPTTPTIWTAMAADITAALKPVLYASARHQGLAPKRASSRREVSVRRLGPLRRRDDPVTHHPND